MTIDDQTKDEKLQYDINREAAKISALWSHTIDKYEYPTGEKILPSNQKQIIGQAKFTYSSLGKAFEKQTKTTEDQKQKQIKAIKDNKKQLANTSANGYKNELLVSKKREIYKNIYNKKLDKTEELTNKINYDLKYVTKSSGIETDFSVKTNPITFLNDIKTNKITVEEAKNSLKDFNKYLNMIQKKKWKKKSNINIRFNGRNDAIKFVEDYGSMILEGKRKATKGEGLKILTPK